MVQVLPDGKVVLCHTRRKNLRYCSSDMLGPVGLGLGPSIVRFVHGGIGGPRGKVRCQTTCICRRQLVTCPLRPQQCVVVSEDAGTVHLDDQPVDHVSQPAETQC